MRHTKDGQSKVYRWASHLELREAAPVLLNVELASGLPGIVSVGEEDGLRTDFLDQAADGLSLLAGTGDSLTVGVTSGRPASLKVKDLLAIASLLEDLELRLDELASITSLGLGVEEGVQVGTENIDSGAEGGTVLLPDVNGLSGGDRAVVATLLESTGGSGDEASELLSSAVAVLDSLVTDNDELDELPVTPLNNLLNEVLGTSDTLVVDEDTDNHLKTVLLGGVTNVLETVAVSTIDTDGGDALGGDLGDIGLDILSLHALTVVGVRREGHAIGSLTVARAGSAGGGR